MQVPCSHPTLAMQWVFLHLLHPPLYTPAQLMYQQQRRHLDTLYQSSISIYTYQVRRLYTENCR